MDKRQALQNRIWTTERSRILAEQRLLHYELLAHFATIWYSFLLVVWSLFQKQLQAYFLYAEQFNIALSVLVLIVSTALYGLKFGEKAEEYKACYHELQLLRARLDASKEGELSSIEIKYVEIVRSTANHSVWDYQKLLVGMWLDGRAGEWGMRVPSVYQVIRYALRFAIAKTAIFFIFVAPLIVVLVAYLWK